MLCSSPRVNHAQREPAFLPCLPCLPAYCWRACPHFLGDDGKTTRQREHFFCPSLALWSLRRLELKGRASFMFLGVDVSRGSTLCAGSECWPSISLRPGGVCVFTTTHGVLLLPYHLCDTSNLPSLPNPSSLFLHPPAVIPARPSLWRHCAQFWPLAS